MRSSRCCGLCGLFVAAVCVAQTFHPDIPRAWNDEDVARFQVPLAQRDRTPRYLTSEEYYALKVRPIYRSYPVYAPGREPAGYMESLKQKEPEIVFDASKLLTKADWIRAGELVFDSFPEVEPLELAPLPPGITVPAARDGAVPGFGYVVRHKGVVELGALTSCAGCHTRVLPGGSVVKGAQGSLPFDRILISGFQQSGAVPEPVVPLLLNAEWSFFGAPWVVTRKEFDRITTVQELVRRHAAIQPGVIGRHGTSSTHPSHVPSLIGIQEIRYLDATGLMRHRSIGDLMRYAISNYGLDIMAHYGDFQPSRTQSGFAESETRFSDEQLYALALYIYSIQPPPNPNRFDDNARRGQRIFQQQGCIGCHTPPLYTNNKLTPAPGFQVPDDLRKSDDIMNVSVGTDPTLAMQTRRGTGFYKVPSLRGVWYRNAFGHNGQAETLEEWLDPARLKDDHVPKGFHLGPGPIKGHEFGLKLAPDDRQALIAFLKTL